MRVDKARWYNDAQCAVVLTIDDLSYGYLDHAGRGVQPFTDWGYACQRENSIFRYFETQFLGRFPEVRYTVFLPFAAHSALLADSGHPRHGGDVFENPEFGALLRHIVATGNEVAYHGHHHGVAASSLEPQSWLDEDREHTPEQYRDLVAEDVARLEREYGIRLSGGRSPGYHNGPGIVAAATSGLFKWWSFDYTPFQCPYGYRRGVFAFPSNVSGSILPLWNGTLRAGVRQWWAKMRLRRLVEERAVISVAEHFPGARPDGLRQGSNLFDDIDSLSRVFGSLRGVDAWYATCTEIAHYRESYDFSELRECADGAFEVVYHGSWSRPFLSLTADCATLIDARTGASVAGVFRHGHWVFNRIAMGRYRSG